MWIARRELKTPVFSFSTSPVDFNLAGDIIKVMAKLDELKTLINQASLSDEDKAVWLKYSEGLSDFFAEHLVYLFSEMPDKVQWLTDNFKRKAEVLLKNDQVGWKKIIAEEKEVLNNLALDNQ